MYLQHGKDVGNICERRKLKSNIALTKGIMHALRDGRVFTHNVEKITKIGGQLSTKQCPNNVRQ